MKQLNRHRPYEGVYGDCFRTAIACLLDYETPEAVPHFWKDDERGCGQQAQMNEWLEREHGLTLVEFPFHADDKYEKIMSTAAFYMNGCYYLLSGTSTTGVGHYVICHAGEIVHDPSIGNSGIVGPLEGYYWIGVLVKALRPAPSSDLGTESGGGGPDDKGVPEQSADDSPQKPATLSDYDGVDADTYPDKMSASDLPTGSNNLSDCADIPTNRSDNRADRQACPGNCYLTDLYVIAEWDADNTNCVVRTCPVCSGSGYRAQHHNGGDQDE